MVGPRITRRSALTALGTGIAGSAALGRSFAVASQEDGSSPFIAGTLLRVEPPAGLHLLNSDGEVAVSIEEATRLWRDHPVRLEEFIRGDEVVCEGAWSADGIFLASTMGSFYRVLEGTLIARTTTKLETDAGTVELTTDSELFNPEGDSQWEDLSAGTKVAILGRLNPESGNLVGLRIAAEGQDGI